MQFGRFRLGLRTIKTAIAVMIIVITFSLLHRPSFIAALAAVFALRDTWEKTLSFGKVRLISNALGGLLGLIYFIVNQATHQALWVQTILLPFFVIIAIVFLDAFNFNTGIIGAMAALLMISLAISPDHTYAYVIERILDTFIGVLVAIAINRFGTPTKKTE